MSYITVIQVSELADDKELLYFQILKLDLTLLWHLQEIMALNIKKFKTHVYPIKVGNFCSDFSITIEE